MKWALVDLCLAGMAGFGRFLLVGIVNIRFCSTFYEMGVGGSLLSRNGRIWPDLAGFRNSIREYIYFSICYAITRADVRRGGMAGFGRIS